MATSSSSSLEVSSISSSSSSSSGVWIYSSSSSSSTSIEYIGKRQDGYSIKTGTISHNFKLRTGVTGNKNNPIIKYRDRYANKHRR